MGSSLILAGLGMAAVGFGGRYIARTMPHLAKRAEEVTEILVFIRNGISLVFSRLTVRSRCLR